MKILVTPIFFLIGIWSFQMSGTGMNIMTKSVVRSVAVNTVSIFRVFVHCVRKRVIGAQFHDHFVPHWKRVAKKNEVDQATMTPIMM